MKNLHLICNAHIDPVWLWTWEEGLTETLSTFRIAARFCEMYDDFVFCHNEALLYQWVEEYEPALFRKIRKLVKEGKWRIIGGWYLQPDCNLPSGESLIRQILAGREYFRKKLKVEPRTAVNFDPFGHSRGLVQILCKSGYDSYLFCRPGNPFLDVPDDFIWTGFDGSEILAHRSLEHYNSSRGKAAEKVRKWIDDHPDVETGIFLWGIGNHGGGPSEEDIRRIDDLRMTIDEFRPMTDDRRPTFEKVRHSWPEAFFDELAARKADLQKIEFDLNPWAVGCYTSMARVKRMHRELEEAYFLTERMVTHAHLAGLMKYPGGVLQEALEAMLFCEFHDILPGSGIPEVEALALQRMGHGLEILSRLRNKAFFNLLAGQIPATKGEFPILVYNPEPFSIEETIVVELQAPEPNFNPEMFLLPELFDQNGQPVEYQLEKESANIANDHRKRLVFKAQLRPSDMNRFSCRLREADILEKPGPPAQQDLRFTNDRCEVWINDETGLVDRYRADGIDCLKPDSFELLVMNDNADPWGMKVTSFRDLAGRFHLVKPSETAGITGTGGPIKPVRIIEDGPVRTVVEAIFRYNRSDAVVTYCIPKKGAEIEIGVRLYWNERDRFLKLAVPTTFKNHQGLGQVAYGVQKFPHDGEEHVAHQWLGLFPEDSGTALTISNSVTYGFDLSDGEIRLSLLRSPAYAGHPVDDITPIVRQDRFTERMDQGAHSFRFRINAGPVEERTRLIDLESRLLNCGSVALCCYPVKKGRHPGGGLILSDKRIRLTTMKMDPENQKIIVRLFENSGNPITAGLEWPGLIPETRLVFKPFEIKTLIIDPVEHVIKESDRLI